MRANVRAELSAACCEWANPLPLQSRHAVRPPLAAPLFDGARVSRALAAPPRMPIGSIPPATSRHLSANRGGPPSASALAPPFHAARLEHRSDRRDVSLPFSARALVGAFSAAPGIRAASGAGLRARRRGN